MNIISQITVLKEQINSINLNLHIISSTLHLLELLDPIPNNILSKLSNPEIYDVVSKTSSSIDELNTLLSKLNPTLKDEIYKNKYPSNKELPYAGFKVDEKPITGKMLNEEPLPQSTPKLITFEELNKLHIQETGKAIRPVNHKTELPYKGVCPFCGAPNEYIYDNNHKGQFLCKVCHNTLSSKTKFYDELDCFCPHCRHKLCFHHDRNNYIVYYCPNHNCSYYIDSLKKQAIDDESIKTNTNRDKLRYTYRAFKFALDDVNKPQYLTNTTVNLNKVHHSPQVVGLILTLYVNYGLSSRKTAMFLKDVFNIRISHQTVMNYAEATASKVQHLAINYPYELGNVLTGDETYIKVLGKSKYVFFFSDTVSKIITSWHIYDNRDTKCAVESILMSLNKYKAIPNDLLVITDGNPIYNAAQVFLSLHDINFNLQQVIGVSNKDEISKKFRPYKQTEERLNRTYKMNYNGTNGYQTLTSANVYMILYVTFFNFLRRHSTLGYQAPVSLEEFNDDNILMQDKWVHLINMSNNYINQDMLFN